MKALIIEDESRAANRLERLLVEIIPEIEIIAKPESIKEALAFFDTNIELDVIFSDIQLGDGLSFEIFENTNIKCPIIFTTAYNQYTLDAFNTNGIDYLLKPIEKERLEKSLLKLKQLTPKKAIFSVEQLTAISNSLTNISTQKEYKSRFVLKIGSKIKSISTQDISVFYSAEKATYLFTKDKRTYNLDNSLGEIEMLINPRKFFRTSRKHIVSIDYIHEIIAYSNSRLKIKIEGLEEEIIVAREKVRDFKTWLGE